MAHPNHQSTSNMSTAMITVNPASATWNSLPDELQLLVFEHLTQMARPISNKTHHIHVSRILQPLLLTSKKFRRAARELYYENSVRLLRERLFQKSYGKTHSYLAMAFPAPSVGHFVKDIHLEIMVEDYMRFESVPMDYRRTDRSYCALNQWFTIFYTETTDLVYNKKHTDWQLAFPALKKLDLAILVEGPRDRSSGGDENKIQPARCLGTTMLRHGESIQDVFKDAKVRFCPEFVSVKVSGFACDQQDGTGCPWRCTQTVADAVLDVFKR